MDNIAAMTGALCNEQTLSNHKHTFPGWEEHACGAFLTAWNKALRSHLRDWQGDDLPGLVDGFCGMMNPPEDAGDKQAQGRSAACWNIGAIDPNDINTEAAPKAEK